MVSFEQKSNLLQLALTGSLIVHICLQVALLVVVAVVVRRRRPDAYVPLLIWTIASLVVTVTSPVVTVVVMRLVSATEDVLIAQAWLNAINTAISVGLVILLILGLVRLSEPPKPVVLQASGPFR